MINNSVKSLVCVLFFLVACDPQGQDSGNNGQNPNNTQDGTKSLQASTKDLDDVTALLATANPTDLDSIQTILTTIAEVDTKVTQVEAAIAIGASDAELVAAKDKVQAAKTKREAVLVATTKKMDTLLEAELEKVKSAKTEAQTTHDTVAAMNGKMQLKDLSEIRGNLSKVTDAKTKAQTTYNGLESFYEAIKKLPPNASITAAKTKIEAIKSAATQTETLAQQTSTAFETTIKANADVAVANAKAAVEDLTKAITRVDDDRITMLDSPKLDQITNIKDDIKSMASYIDNLRAADENVKSSIALERQAQRSDTTEPSNKVREQINKEYKEFNTTIKSVADSYKTIAKDRFDNIKDPNKGNAEKKLSDLNEAVTALKDLTKEVLIFKDSTVADLKASYTILDTSHTEAQGYAQQAVAVVATKKAAVGNAEERKKVFIVPLQKKD